MANYNIRTYGYVILGFAFGIYIVIFIATQNLSSIDFNKALVSISTTISINIVIWLCFIKWAWRWRLFYPWLVQFPNLSGDWEGQVKSNWKGTDSITIPITVIIEQTFFHIQVKLITHESRSHSFGASFEIDKEKGIQQLFYSYLNTPKPGVRDHSEIHYGSVMLYFEGFYPKNMQGEYWTTRITTGELELVRK